MGTKRSLPLADRLGPLTRSFLRFGNLLPLELARLQMSDPTVRLRIPEPNTRGARPLDSGWFVGGWMQLRVRYCASEFRGRCWQDEAELAGSGPGELLDLSKWPNGE